MVDNKIGAVAAQRIKELVEAGRPDEFIIHIIAEICDHAVMNNKMPDDLLDEVSVYIFWYRKHCTFNTWKIKKVTEDA